MTDDSGTTESLSPWWRHAVILTMVVGFTILIWLSARTYQDAPPIPQRVVGTSGETVFTQEDILAGQSVFLKYGLMDNGSIWGHGAYLGPDFSAAYLHALVLDTGELIAKQKFGRSPVELSATERNAVSAETQQLLKQNRYAV
ncbi:MAG TPA: nitric-oxide reductase large subunit, partial [Candidatus Binatia bacterium]